ncbi:two-component system chemotaxis response regulator CheB [Virgibacillus natechei]|uniref:Protein-glutamate methylesterase/protein-glutamine glutaminase n=1 Tax=Virgibacillus natechei TaxID=1216297 RepID=A0ABS4ICC1_9BACI|nr:chemotaxis response regulator protein-glutamate methylesterase [Virgibacillus natechei]MBP1968081.1 two-component system chemotaxis response regulator CheB [Virgibacillus natechei]UZD14638.1 chemotaxis response regulator protein-glutamate methylesterase [Virgibacillus natechei]
MHLIRVIVIDDSAFMRKIISDILESENRIKVIATARNGEIGIQKIKELVPDVVTMDIHMPVMDGITALQQIMHRNPLPVIMLSSSTKDGTDRTVQAMSNGAVDFIMKPSGSISLDIESSAQEIITKVINAAEAKVNHSSQLNEGQASQNTARKKQPFEKTIVSIGTSTGGPRALQQVLMDIPNDFLPPILIVQHMPEKFTKSLAERLDTLTNMHVKEAVHGETIKDRTAYIAPGGLHMKAKKTGNKFVIELINDALLYRHQPSVDVLFKSVANLQQVNKFAVILTGMGNDGAEGIKRLKEADENAVVIAESEETSIVYGMPNAAVKTNCVDHVLPLNQIGLSIANLVRSSKGRR